MDFQINSTCPPKEFSTDQIRLAKMPMVILPSSPTRSVTRYPRISKATLWLAKFWMFQTPYAACHNLVRTRMLTCLPISNESKRSQHMDMEMLGSTSPAGPARRNPSKLWMKRVVNEIRTVERCNIIIFKTKTSFRLADFYNIISLDSCIILFPPISCKTCTCI